MKKRERGREGGRKKWERTRYIYTVASFRREKAFGRSYAKRTPRLSIGDFPEEIVHQLGKIENVKNRRFPFEMVVCRPFEHDVPGAETVSSRAFVTGGDLLHFLRQREIKRVTEPNRTNSCSIPVESTLLQRTFAAEFFNDSRNIGGEK